MDNDESDRKTGELSPRVVSEFDSLTISLRQMHDIVANEPIPDDFLDLLDKIDAKMSASKNHQ